MYWCAYFGLIEKVKAYLDSGLSPLFKCHNRRSIIAGAVLGGQLEVVKLILSKNYVSKSSEDDLKMKLLLDTDLDGNTLLHFAFAKHQPEIRRQLRRYAKEKVLIDKLK